MKETNRVLFLLVALLTGCASYSLKEGATPANASAAPPDPKLVCRLLEASRCAYGVERFGVLSDRQEFLTCANGLRDWRAIDDQDQHINAVLVELADDAVIIAYRGTLPPRRDGDSKATLEDWTQDIEAGQVAENNIDGKMHAGFHGGFQQTWDSLMAALQAWKGKGELERKKVYVTGHSKGGAMAVISALHLYNQGVKPDAVYTFAAARAGDQAFVTGYGKMEIATWRYENRFDIVPHLPPNMGDVNVLASHFIIPAALRTHEYQSTGNLVFINWEGKLQPDSQGLEEERIRRFDSLFEKPGAAEVILNAHSAEKTRQYYQAICAQTNP